MRNTLLLLALIAVGVGIYFVQQHFASLPLEQSYLKVDDISSPTLKKLEEALQINVGLCQPTEMTIAAPFGSTAVQAIGKKGGYCELRYSNEVENPSWDGELDTICMVPIDPKIKIFSITNYGVDFESISQYCQTN